METVSKLANRYSGRYRGAPRPISVALPKTPPIAERKHILIIDDDPFFRNLMKVLLEQTGLPIEAVWEAGDSWEALPIVRQHAIDLVFCDLNLPRNFSQDGIAIVRQIRSIRPDVPVYMVTAENSSEVVETVCRAGATGHLLKPLNLRMLRRVLTSTFFPNLSEEEPANPARSLLGEPDIS